MRLISIKVRLAFGILMAGITGGAAQQSTPSPALRASALGLVDTIGIERLLASATRQVLLTHFIPGLLTANPGRLAEIQQAFDRHTVPRLNQIYATDQVRTIVAGFYGQSFSQSELDELRRFFSSPLGRRLSAAMPEIADTQVNLVRNLMATTTAQGALILAIEDLQSRGFALSGQPR